MKHRLISYLYPLFVMFIAALGLGWVCLVFTLVIMAIRWLYLHA